MRTLLAVLLTSSLAFAQDPPAADSPLAASGDYVHLLPGQPAPYGPLSCLTDTAYIESEKAAREDHEVAKAVRPGSGYAILPTWSIVAMIVGGVALGATAGTVVALVAKKP